VLRRLALAVLALVVFPAVSRPQEPARDPFLLFGAAGRLSAGDRRDLRAGRTVVRMLEESERSHVAVFVAARIDVTPAQFAERIRNSAALWKGEAVPATGTFSTPVRPEDVADLTLHRKDVDALGDCRPGDCLVKLGAGEIERLRQRAVTDRATWREDVQAEFRRVVLDRIVAYRRGGLRSVPAFHDHAEPVEPEAVFSRLLAVAQSVIAEEPQVAEYFRHYPQRPLPPGALDYIYWVSTSETPRPTVQALHVVVHRRGEGGHAEVVAVSRQVFATHYINGSLAITALLRDPSDPSVRYMVYLNRSAVDGLGGFFSGLKRFFIERRIRGAAKSAFERLKQRIAA
jgi:hypothetical protein